MHAEEHSDRIAQHAEPSAANAVSVVAVTATAGSADRATKTAPTVARLATSRFATRSSPWMTRLHRLYSPTSRHRHRRWVTPTAMRATFKTSHRAKAQAMRDDASVVRATVVGATATIVQTMRLQQLSRSRHKNPL